MKVARYSYENLINSKYFMDCSWAAQVALDPNKQYSLKEAQRIVNTFLKRKVKE